MDWPRLGVVTSCGLYKWLTVRMRMSHKGVTVDGVTESLPDLIGRRMKELGASSIRALHARLPDDGDRISSETVRLLKNGQQKDAGDRTIRDLALMLGVSENEVRQALDLPPTYGPWQIPERANVLTPRERTVVMSVIDALVSARTEEKQWASGNASSEDVDQSGAPEAMEDSGASVTQLHPWEEPRPADTFDPHDQRRVASRPSQEEREARRQAEAESAHIDDENQDPGGVE